MIIALLLSMPVRPCLPTPNAVLESVIELETREHLRETEDEATGVTVDELNASKKRKMDVEALSLGGNLQTTLAANHAEVMAQFALLVPLAELVAKNANNSAVRHVVSKSKCLSPC
jgi:hypothetical protein